MNLFERGQRVVMDAPQLYIDVDIETDGWAGYGSMLSLGAVEPLGGTFYREIRPISEDFVVSQREFCESHGLERDRLIVQASGYRQVMTEFKSWVDRAVFLSDKQSAVFTAFNAGFDFGFVQLYFLRAGLENPFGTAPFDLKSLALAINPAWDWSQTSKGRLPAKILPPGDFEHHALKDALYQQQLHFGLAALLNENHTDFLSTKDEGGAYD